MNAPIDPTFHPHDPPVHIVQAALLFARLTGKTPGDGGRSTVLPGMTRAQILQQAASAIMTQGNGQPTAVLALLR